MPAGGRSASSTHQRYSCARLKAFLADYLGGELPPKARVEVERHIHHCTTCQCVIDSIQKTILLYRKMIPAKMPDRIHQHLLGILRKKYKRGKEGCLRRPRSHRVMKRHKSSGQGLV